MRIAVNCFTVRVLRQEWLQLTSSYLPSALRKLTLLLGLVTFSTMKNILNEMIARFLLLARMTILLNLEVYVLCTAFYLLLRLLLGDSRWWLAFLNAFSAYIFIPIPIILLLVLLTRQRWLILATAAIAI